MKKKILFIINPISGGKKKDEVPAIIAQNLDGEIFDHEIIFTTAPKQAGKIASQNLQLNDVIIAVGGDGTVNEIAAALAGTEKIFGILPYGSGNGLSRFLQVPMDAAQAVKNLNYLNIQSIDAGKLNGRWFFNMAGLGFDAYISEVFAHQKGRGLINYIRSSLKELFGYKPQLYRINIDGAEHDSDAFILSIANSSQYGNNVHIAPAASVQDGLLDICIIRPFPLYRFFDMVVRALNKTAQKFEYLKIIKGKHIIIKREAAGPVHIDGEPMTMDGDICIEVVPAALKVLVGKNYIK